jgi:hypothetical protein
MKKFNLLALFAIVAMIFVACEPKTPTPDVAKMVVKYGDTELKGGETITVSEVNYGEMVAHFFIVNNAERPTKFTVTEVRRFDANTQGSAMCFSTCMQGNSEPEQVWETDAVNPGLEQTADYHLYLKQNATTTTSEADLIFSDGEAEIKVLVKFAL